MNPSVSPWSVFRTLSLALVTSLACANAAELRVSTDFEGGSAIVESVDQTEKMVRVMPGGDPQRGWPCWWYLRVDGVAKGERVTINLTGSNRVQQRADGKVAKPLSPSWAMPMRASFSTDGKEWQHTAPGRRDGSRILYEVTGTGGPLWIAWGPPFTPRDTDELIAQTQKQLPTAKAFDLTKTREDRTVRGLRISDSERPARLGIWVQARQHAWESGASWVARGFVEWLASDDADARWVRENAETVIVPIMDVDNVATGNGGKDAAPHDHNRDWSDKPIYPEIAAAQQHLRDWAAEGRLTVFLDLHNPAPSDMRSFFFVGPDELLDEVGRKNRADFLEFAQRRISGPLTLDEKTRVTGPGYHPLWKQMSRQWVNSHADPRALAMCLETSWNTPHSTSENYRAVGKQLGQAVADYLRRQP